MSPDQLAAQVAILTEQVSELRARLDSLDAHGLTALQFGQLSDHPVRYATTVPTTSDMTANGQLRVVRTGGADYIYVRSNGAIVRVLVS